MLFRSELLDDLLSREGIMLILIKCADESLLQTTIVWKEKGNSVTLSNNAVSYFAEFAF